MDFLVVGPGAMGCLFASRLKRAGHEVTLFDYREDRAKLLSERGILVEEGGEESTRVRVPTVTGNVSRVPDVVLLCVKAGSTRQAAERLRASIGPGTRILTLQNGLGNVETLVEMFGKGSVLGGVTAEGATVLGPGHIRHAGRGETVIGPSGPAGDPTEEIVRAFHDAGFKTRSEEGIEGLIWGKLIVNIGINALAAITRLKNGRLSKVPGTRKVMEMAVEEAVAVARAKGIALPYPAPIDRVFEVCEATAENIASMLQDVLNRRKTEVAFIHGAIAREGETLGIPTPANRLLTCLVEALQETYEERVAEMGR
jgi:2-dehydropantoate 2-reductase